jgi:hypothetical protein
MTDSLCVHCDADGTGPTEARFVYEGNSTCRAHLSSLRQEKAVLDRVWQDRQRYEQEWHDRQRYESEHRRV